MSENKNLENKKSDNIYFGNSVDGNRIFPSLRFLVVSKNSLKVFQNQKFSKRSGEAGL